MDRGLAVSAQEVADAVVITELPEGTTPAAACTLARDGVTPHLMQEV